MGLTGKLNKWLGALAALACVVAAPARAQTPTEINRAALQQQINDLLPNNTTGQITPFYMREILLNITASTGTLLDPFTNITLSGVWNQAFTTDPPITASGFGASLNNNANYSGLSVTLKPFPGYSGYDGLTVVADSPVGSTVIQVNGVGSYVEVHGAGTLDGTGDGVNYFGVCLAGDLTAHNGGNCWFGNGAGADDSTPGTYTGSTTARRLTGIEYDAYVYHDDTTVLAFTATPANATTAFPHGRVYAFVAQPATAGDDFWNGAFVSQDGAAATALVVGKLGGGGGTQYSQFIAFAYSISGAPLVYNMQVDNSGILELTGSVQIGKPSGSTVDSGFLQFLYTNSGTPGSISLFADVDGNIDDTGGFSIGPQAGTTVFSNFLFFNYVNASTPGHSTISASNTGLFIFDHGILAATGTIGATAYLTGTGGTTAGVTCATGSPTSSFAAVGGIVTHC